MSKFKWRLNLYRRKKFWADAGCIFIHVPKAAGTSVNHALYGRTLGHYSALEIEKTFPRLFERAFTFTLVRNPWDRALSAYRFARQGQTDSMGVLNPGQYQIPGFDSFERFVNDWLPAQDLLKTDFIFQPQSHFACDANGEIMVDFVGKVESLNKDMQIVSARLGRNISVGKSNSTRLAGTDYRSAFTSNEMIDAISTLYRNDVNKFGYCFE
ncbi:Sulfotransferase family protein [Alcanivorax sp. DSM 26293]|uniref:sulfotransferase family 2 domain-containing protein n=1 Tax=Alcanivorax sp. DSM 26293 TaxID=1798238 RepID=UPI00089FA36B|nr:sulfotransferase family 2 domain-containing protein [Alcanivorax sp. DSM 26293]SEF40124.1 Sulfotransferase family protein [Alcanivorax sp. DSM 26293]